MKFTIPMPEITISSWGNDREGYNYADIKGVRKLLKFTMDLAQSHNDLMQEVIKLRENVKILNMFEPKRGTNNNQDEVK